MRTIFIILVVFCSFLTNAQTIPTIVIDNTPIKFQGDISLPYWVGAGKSVQLGQNAVTASILEFTLVNNEMEFSQAIHLTNNGTVPTGKVWKIEAIGIGNNTNYNSINSNSSANNITLQNSPITFSTPGVYSWTAPPNVTYICIEAWGAGGDGGTAASSTCYTGGGGGGGGYGYSCLNVVPGSSYTVTVASSTNNLTTSFGSFISATSGSDGGNAVTNYGAGGAGGVSTGSFSISGGNGANGTGNCASANGKGGQSGNTGYGGLSGACDNNSTWNNGFSGTFPGGGGGGASGACGTNSGTPGLGANGQIIIYF